MYNTISRWDISRGRLNVLLSGLAGGLFFSGWWIMIDVISMNKAFVDQHQVYHLPGIIATMAMVAVNAFPMHYLHSDGLSYSTGCCTPCGARLYFLLWLTVSFGAMISAFYILINDFLLAKSAMVGVGVNIWLQNAFIFAANMILRFGIWQETF